MTMGLNAITQRPALPRRVEPELLDSLPPEEPCAIRSRRDLRRVNAMMMNGAFVARELSRAFGERPPRVIAEIGAGDGHFMLQVAHRLPQWRALDVLLLDRQSLVSGGTIAEFRTLGWRAQAIKSEVRAWLAQPMRFAPDVIVANLFLHHFDTAGLFELLSMISQRTRVLIACEPRRSRFALAGSRLLAIAGCNAVTRHDAVASVHAGFSDQELSANWPQADGWTLREAGYGLFSHYFVAVRADGGTADAAAQ
ncbi:MAG: hypothetical protein JWN94_4974 [Betaproteobacteria bacterium]|nr:hypothetical protein [Betaproteobacteria bacterium]